MLMPARRSEIASMRWADLNLIDATWTLKPEQNKSRRAVTFALSSRAIEVLASLSPDSPWVFTTNGKGPIKGYSHAKSVIDASLRDRVDEWRIHDLRRTCATKLAEL